MTSIAETETPGKMPQSEWGPFPTEQLIKRFAEISQLWYQAGGFNIDGDDVETLLQVKYLAERLLMHGAVNAGLMHHCVNTAIREFGHPVDCRCEGGNDGNPF